MDTLNFPAIRPVLRLSFDPPPSLFFCVWYLGPIVSHLKSFPSRFVNYKKKKYNKIKREKRSRGKTEGLVKETQSTTRCDEDTRKSTVAIRIS